jgi:hypothetical protein
MWSSNILQLLFLCFCILKIVLRRIGFYLPVAINFNTYMIISSSRYELTPTEFYLLVGLKPYFFLLDYCCLCLNYLFLSLKCDVLLYFLVMLENSDESKPNIAKSMVHELLHKYDVRCSRWFDWQVRREAANMSFFCSDNKLQ